MVFSGLRTFLKCLISNGCIPQPPSRRQLRVEVLEHRWCPATLNVGNGYPFTTIGNALGAAQAGDEIDVHGGTYTEQVTIATNNIKLVGIDGPTIDSPPNVTPVIVGSSNIGAALIDVTATNDTVTGFTIDGTTNSDGNLYEDVRVRDGGSATINDNTLLGPGTAPSNPIYGIGIQVGESHVTGTAGAGTARINSNDISQYYGAGIVVDGARAHANIGTAGGNTITGNDDPNSGVAQNGVQVSRGASATVQGNRITNNVAAGNSSGIFFFDVSSPNNVACANAISNNSYGILVQDSTGSRSSIQVVQNRVTGSGFAGIDVLSSSNVAVNNNSVSGSVITAQNPGGNGIALGFSSNVTVENNVVHGDQSDGIYDYKGSGNLIQYNNSYRNGGNGTFLDHSTGDWVLGNTTWDNTLSGVYVFFGSGNDIRFGFSHGNTQDGILLQNTTGTTIVGNVVQSNIEYGVRLLSSSHTLIAFNAITQNSAGPILIDALSTNVVFSSNLPGLDGNLSL
jgi:parallel beta-helix repeat protein